MERKDVTAVFSVDIFSVYFLQCLVNRGFLWARGELKLVRSEGSDTRVPPNAVCTCSRGDCKDWFSCLGTEQRRVQKCFDVVLRQVNEALNLEDSLGYYQI